MKTRKRRPVDRLRSAEHIWDRVLACQTISEATATMIANKVRVAHQLLREGKADQQQFVTVGTAINVATIRAEQIGGSGQVQEALWLAGQFMNDCQERRERTGTFLLSGPGLQAVAEAIDAYELILRASTPRQMEDAAQEVWRRVGGAKR
jgi:sRNA-binding regulator protein Hfq